MAAFLLVLARIGPLFAVAPFFSSKMFPMRARMICAVALAVGLTPVVGRGQVIALEILPLTGLLMKEALVGLAFAFSLSLLFAALQVAGSFLDTLIGFSYGSLVDPITGTSTSVLANLYGLVGVAIFLAIGGDTWVIAGLARTYELVPLADAPELASLIAGVIHVFTHIFAAALEVAAPVLLALVLTDAAFGVVSRVVPQLNVFAVGFPAKIAVGLLFVGISLPFVGAWLADGLQQSVKDALGALQVA
jgi:flagellar biosynthetic protein FliR